MQNAPSGRKYRFNIGVLGFPDKELAAAVYHPLHDILDDILHYTRTHEATAFHITDREALSFDFYACPRLSSPLFIDWWRDWHHGDMAAVLPGEPSPGEPYAAADIYQTLLPDYDLYKNGDNALISWIVNQADIGLIVQSGGAADGGNARNFINQCADNKIPCLLLEVSPDGTQVHWFESGHPVPYAADKLDAYIKGLYPLGVDLGGVKLDDPFDFPYQDPKADQLVPNRADFAPQRFWGYRWLERASKRFEKKHGTSPRYSKDVNRDMLSDYERAQQQKEKHQFQSAILGDAYVMQSDSPDADAIRQNHQDYRQCFQYYTYCGDRCNDVHRSFTYFRVHAPLWASICLALGFYAETLLGYITPDALAPLWVVLASVGFLLGALSIWVLKLANNAVEANRRKFLFLRYVSENLRALPFHSAFGLPFHSRFLHADIASTQDDVRAASAKILRRALRYKHMARYRIDAAALRDLSDHLDFYLQEQEKYQQESRVNRFENISLRLNRQLKIWMIIQTAALTLRGVFQFGMGIWGPGPNPSDAVLEARKFATSLANCLALLLPALFDLRSRQKNGEGYATNLVIAQNALKNLKGLRQKLDAARAQQTLGYEAMAVLGDDILEKILEEQAAWHNAIAGQ
jgi:hypothetical protein